MSDNREIVMRNKISYTDLAGGGDGVMRLVLDMKEQKLDRVYVGAIHGRADGLAERESPDKTKVYIGLRGRFEAVPVDETIPVLRSAVCYLTDPLQNDVIERIRSQERDRMLIGYEFAAEFTVYLASNARGYSWEAVMVGGIDEADPFEATRKRLAASGRDRKALPAPRRRALRREPAEAQAEPEPASE